MPSDQGPTDPRRDDRNPDIRNQGAREPDDDLGPVHEQRPASDYYDDDPYDDYDDGPRLLARRLVQGGIALLAVVLFLGVVWYAYIWGSRSAATGDVPVVSAPEGAEKVEPEDPGGMDVPHQDKLVLNQDGDGGNGEVERLLPPPEEPRPPERSQPAQGERAQAEPGSAPAAAPAADAPAADAPAETGGDGEQVAELPETTVPDQDMADGEQAGSATADGEGVPASVAEASEAETADTPMRTPGRKPGGDGQATPTQTAEADPAQSPAQATDQATDQAADPSANAPAEGRYAVQIAAFQSEQAARTAWSRYQQRFPEVLSGQRLLLQNAEVDGQTYWRVRTGPFADRSAAQSVCDRLKARDQSCLPVTR